MDAFNLGSVGCYHEKIYFSIDQFIGVTNYLICFIQDGNLKPIQL